MEQVFYAIRICRQQAEPSDDEMKDNGCQPKKAVCSAPWWDRPLGWSPPKWETQCPVQIYAPVQNFCKICSAVSEEMRLQQTDIHTNSKLS